jgi:AcrR family transcriptional regulator
MNPLEPATPEAIIERAPGSLAHRAKRADAQRNHDRIVLAARSAFGERGASTSLEEIARRAGVGIGTLYRNFPNRQSLLETVYVDEVEDICRSAVEFASLEPWEGFASWLRRVVAYMGTKQALANELFDYLDRDAPLFQSCRTGLFSAGQTLLDRAQRARAVRTDVGISDVIQLVSGLAKNQMLSPEQVERLLEITFDGLRYRGD